MIRAALKYSFLNAKARTMHSKRLRPSDWHLLETTKGGQGFIQYLATTSYGEWAARFLEHKEIKELFEREIFRALFDDYHKILHSTDDKYSKELLLSLFSRFEAENLKIVLRGIFTGQHESALSHLLYPVQKISRLPWGHLWKQNDIRKAAKLLAHTPFGPHLEQALPQFEAQGRLFPIEMALDISCFRRISGAVAALGLREDRRRVRRLLGSYVDVMNICHIARLRFIYNLSPEEVLNYSFPGGHDLNLRTLHNLARTEDLENMLNALPTSFRTVAERGGSTFSSLRLRMEEWLIRRLRKGFLGSPFHLGVPVAHLIEKEMETRSIVSLFNAKSQALPLKAEEIVPASFIREGGEEIAEAG